MTIDIRECGITDAASVCRIDELDAEMARHYPASSIHIVDFAEFNEAAGAFLVTYADGEPIGCGALRPLSAEATEVKRMFVRPRHRRQGHSRALLDTYENSARSRDSLRLAPPPLHGAQSDTADCREVGGRHAVRIPRFTPAPLPASGARELNSFHADAYEEIPMAHYEAEVIWQRAEQPFLDNRYSRRHLLRFDGGIEIPGSASPHVVPLPMSDPAAVDPEEAFVSALSSCHMLWFLSVAVKHNFRVDCYHDKATGEIARNDQGKLVISTVTLRPDVRFSGDRVPTPVEVDAMHHEAHQECFIANSVKTEVRCEPVRAAL